MSSRLRAYVRQHHVALLALFFSLGLGSAWAATDLSRNEVKSKHIGPGQVKQADIANNAISSQKVSDGSLLLGDFAAGQIPPGPIGPQGQQGPTGPQGVTGAEGQAGLEGPTGPQGVTGPRGFTGPRGATGPEGVTGPQGVTGPEGSAGLTNVTSFTRPAGVSDQPKGGPSKPILTATGLPAGTYLVTYRMVWEAPDANVNCGIAHGSIGGSSGMSISEWADAGINSPTIHAAGVMTISEPNQDQILWCWSPDTDWTVIHVQLHFIKIATVTDGVEG